MARPINRLSARAVATLGAGYHADGGGLYLQVSVAGSRSWIFRFTSPVTGRVRDMGLGSLQDVTLKMAREEATKARGIVASRQDPMASRAAARASANRLWGDAVEDLIATMRHGWKSTTKGKRVRGPSGEPIGSQENQWRQSLLEYGPPFDMPVAAVTTQVILNGLRPIWKPRDQGGKVETATRVRGRAERVWEAERVAGNVAGANPARWRGHLEHLLPSPEKLKQKRHHAALPYEDAPALYSALRFRSSRTARALRFLLLTAARTDEVVGMPDLSEIDFDAGLWRIPGARMKAAVDHEVPLVPEALELLRGLDPSLPPFALSENSMLFFIQRAPPKGLGLAVTVHGLRSTFRDWVSETTDHPREVAEMSLAHQIKDKTEAAYRRGKLREKRRSLMTDWQSFLQHGPPAATVRVSDSICAPGAADREAGSGGCR